MGLSVGTEDLALVGEMKNLSDFRRGHLHIFVLHLRELPALRIDRREIVAAWFVDPATLLAERNLRLFIRIYLTDVLAGGARRNAPPACYESGRTVRQFSAQAGDAAWPAGGRVRHSHAAGGAAVLKGGLRPVR